MLKYKLSVFGKRNHAETDELLHNITEMLASNAISDAYLAFEDVQTVTGVVNFSELSCLNPQRVPAMVISRYNPETDAYEAIGNPTPEGEDVVCKKSRLYQIMGLQTDYSVEARGIISQEMIAHVITESMK